MVDGSRAPLFIATDSLSVVLALSNGPWRQRDGAGIVLWRRLLEVAAKGRRVLVGFIYAHTADDGDASPGDSLAVLNRAADALATEALQAPPTATDVDLPSPWWHDTARAAAAVLRARSEVGAARGTLREQTGLASAPAMLTMRAFRGVPPSDIRLIVQCRTGVCPPLGGHLHEISTPCRHCGAALQRPAIGGVTHAFECPAPHARWWRSQLDDLHLTDLWRRPAAAAAYVRRMLAAPQHEDG